MRVPDDYDEPCALDYADDPARFAPPADRPSGPSWWKGWWPAGGINSLADLAAWVMDRREQMIDLQDWDSLAEHGRRLGVQTLRNADRYLGLYGKGDHPPRPSDDDLRRTDVVENALEAILRYLRQQTSPPEADLPQTVVKVSDGKKQPAALQSWTQDKLDAAIREYIARRAPSLKDLREGVQENGEGAKKAARKMFGRNVIARALGVKSRAMVTLSKPWQEIADELHLRPNGVRGLKSRRKVGFDEAVEDKSASVGDTTADEVQLRDAINFVRRKVNGKKKVDAVVQALRAGTVAPEDVEKMVDLLNSDRGDANLSADPADPIP